MSAGPEVAPLRASGKIADTGGGEHAHGKSIHAAREFWNRTAVLTGLL